MSRFKKLTPIPGVGDEVAAEIALGNDLHYKQLVPQVGGTELVIDLSREVSKLLQSAVFTLGFSPSDGSLLAKETLRKEQKLTPSFPRLGLADRGMPEGGGG